MKHQIFEVSTYRLFIQYDAETHTMHTADNGCIYITKIGVGVVLVVNSKDFYYKRKEDD